MKRVFNTSAEVAHLWAHQVQDDARCRNASFEGFKFYSHSTVIAQIRRNDMGRELVLISDYNYSATTTKHKGDVFRTASHMKIISVAEPTAILSDHDVNYRAFLRRHEDITDLASRARQRKGQYLSQANNIAKDMADYAEFFSLEWNIPNKDKSAIELLAAYEVWREQEDQKRRVKRAAEEAEGMAKWLAGEDTRFTFHEMRLRIKGDEIQTSYGATIPIEHAVKVWPLLHRAHNSGKPLLPSPERSIHLGHYKLNSFENDVLTVGCHRIPYSELARMAEQLNLTESAHA